MWTHLGPMNPSDFSTLRIQWLIAHSGRKEKNKQIWKKNRKRRKERKGKIHVKLRLPRNLPIGEGLLIFFFFSCMRHERMTSLQGRQIIRYKKYMSKIKQRNIENFHLVRLVYIATLAWKGTKLRPTWMIEVMTSVTLHPCQLRHD